MRPDDAGRRVVLRQVGHDEDVVVDPAVPVVRVRAAGKVRQHRRSDVIPKDVVPYDEIGIRYCIADVNRLRVAPVEPTARALDDIVLEQHAVVGVTGPDDVASGDAVPSDLMDPAVGDARSPFCGLMLWQ